MYHEQFHHLVRLHIAALRLSGVSCETLVRMYREVEGSAAAMALTHDPDILKRPFTDLKLSVRSRKAILRLLSTRVDVTLGDVHELTANQLLEMKNFGPSSLDELRKKLAGFGLKLRGD